MNTITVKSQAHPEGYPEAAIRIDLNLNFSDDAPPALVQAIAHVLIDLHRACGREGDLRKLAAQCEEIRARNQRRADHAARMLLGDEKKIDDENPGENEG
jgi:hypothetical protein